MAPGNGSSVPKFEGKNFAYWKVRMSSYLEAISPECWQAASVGFDLPLDRVTKLSGMLKLKMLYLRELVKRCSLELGARSMLVIFGPHFVKFMRAQRKFVRRGIMCS